MDHAGESALDWYNLAWNPTGSHFALCGLQGDVKVIRNGTWKTEFTLTHFEDISIVQFSPNGVYLMCIGFKRLVAIWRLEESRTVPAMSMKHTERITAAKWHPQENQACLVVLC